MSLSLPRRLFRLFLPRIATFRQKATTRPVTLGCGRIAAHHERNSLRLERQPSRVATSIRKRELRRATRRSTSARGDLPDAPDADLDAEPEELMCPITRTVFRDPVLVVDSGTRTRGAPSLSHFGRNGSQGIRSRDRALSSTKVMTTGRAKRGSGLAGQAPWRDARRMGQSRASGAVEGSTGRERSTTRVDVGVLRTWRAMCPELQERWPEARADPEHGRV